MRLKMLMYGRGAAAIAEQNQSTVEEAQAIIDKFYREFPKVKKWIDETEYNAKQHGYVEDLWGRRRRLPDIQLPQYVVKMTNQSVVDFNPLIGSKLIYTGSGSKLIESYTEKLKSARGFKDVNKIKSDATRDGVTIVNNGAFISRAERQCVNARIQGGAASMSKRAMIAIYNDEEMKKLGFRLLIMVHDELIGECPVENVDKCKARLSYLMENSGKPEVNLPMKCDAVEFSHWYIDEYSASVKDSFNKLLSKCGDKDKALNKLFDEYSESTEDDLIKILQDKLI